jgi:magnesium-transporting ATPase (P-type)
VTVTTVRGLSSARAGEVLARVGPNVLPPPPSRNPAWELAAQLTHLFALMLWVASGLAVLAGMPQLALAIVVVVLVNGVFAFAQEYRADQAASRLRDLVPATAQVRRDGVVRPLPVADVVPGDVVLVSAGERVCADLTLDEAHSVSVDESLLTGESVPARVDAGGRVWCGTFLVEGEAEGVVTDTGARTRLGAIARLTQARRLGASPLKLELHGVVRTVSLIAAVVGALLFAVSALLGLTLGDAFVVGLGVTVALVPEGLLPTLTLSLARAAQRMAGQSVLVRRLEAVETLGATTFVCTDKTGTLTVNQMSAVAVWTPSTGGLALNGSGYDPTVPPGCEPGAQVQALGQAAASCVRGRAVLTGGCWHAQGDPMEVALDVLARRLGESPRADEDVVRRLPFTAARMRSSVVVSGTGRTPPEVYVLGPPEVVGSLAAHPVAGLDAAVRMLTDRGLRVVAAARRAAPDDWRTLAAEALERDLEILGVVGLEDPPRPDVSAAVARCRQAGIRVAVVTGDHPATGLAVAREVGLAGPDTIAVTSAELPRTDHELAALMTREGGVVVARVSPQDKRRIALALRKAGEVVAMTGDGVNDGPALRAADVGVAMGASGSDVAREAADIVLLDDHFASIVAGIELGRATFTNIRRFLTYHLTDNVAELAPFAVWALSAGRFPLAIGVLQVLALDIGTDLLPALALGAEPPSPRTLQGPVRTRHLVDRALLWRAFGLLGPVEAAMSLLTFAFVLLLGGWQWGEVPGAGLLATASGGAFVAIVVGQLANALACRSQTRPAWATRLRGNGLLAWALVVEVVVCLGFVDFPPLASVLGGGWPSAAGMVGVGLTAVAVVLADAGAKAVSRRRRARSARR